MQSRRFTITVAIITTAVMLTSTACSKTGGSNPGGRGTPRGVALFGTDGIMSNSFGEAVKPVGELSGMSGTAALMPFTDAFKARMMKQDRTLVDFTYAGQSYDAVVITALAAQIAHTTDARTVATYIDGVTTLQKGGVECTDVKACFADIAAGKDIAYRGAAVTNGFTKVGEPSVATYAALHFDNQNKLDGQKTEYVNAGDPSTASTTAPPAPKGNGSYSGPALKLGLLLPKTGALAGSGKPIFAAVEVALKDVNAAGGVLGKPVVTVTEDDGTDVGKATAGANRLIDDGVNAIIGPSFSGAATAVVPIAAAAGVIVFSPSATSAVLTTINDKGLFFRTAPSDILQAQAIADVIMRSGAQRVFIVARNDTYGTGLEHDVSAALTTGGLPKADLQTAEYSVEANVDNTRTFSTIAQSIVSFNTDSVLLLGYDETSGVVDAMAAAHITFRD
jgi:ABC-type branched-subunit amino acid transport system substrate-binding protein